MDRHRINIFFLLIYPTITMQHIYVKYMPGTHFDTENLKMCATHVNSTHTVWLGRWSCRQMIVMS